MAIDLTSSTPNGQHTSPSHVASSKSLLNVFLSGSVFGLVGVLGSLSWSYLLL